MKVASFSNQNKYNNTLLITELSTLKTGQTISKTGSVTMGIDWSDLMSVGINEMDDEHKELFIRINKLLASLMDDSIDSEMTEVVRFINEYIAYHFGNEEQLMASYDYPGLDDHKKIWSLYQRKTRKDINGIK